MRPLTHGPVTAYVSTVKATLFSEHGRMDYWENYTTQ